MMLAGNVPVKELESKVNWVNDNIDPILSGIGPVNEFVPTAKCSNDVKDPTLLGTVPCKDSEVNSIEITLA